MQAEPQVTPERIVQFGFGYASTLIVEAAVRTGIFDALDRGPKTVEEVSADSEASIRGARAIMNALLALNLLSKGDDGKYSLTPESAKFLVSGKPGFIGGLFRHATAQLIPKWLNLTEIVKTGLPLETEEEDSGAEFFKEFVEEIFPMSYPAAKALGQALNLGESQTEIRVLDVAAGSGVWGVALAQASPKVRVTALDWPEVLDVTNRVAQRFGVDDRFEFLGGDMLTIELDEGFDIATLGHILHVRGEEDNRKLIDRLYTAMAPGGTIAVQEFLVNEDRTGPPQSLIFAVNMLVNTDKGNTYSFAEISRWLTDAGFVNPRLLDAPGPSPLVLANKPA